MQTPLDAPPTPDDPTPVDVLVIGGGLAGLSAAAHAARRGARVAVLESMPRAGGRARSEHRDGVTLNQGPHALYEGGSGMTILRDLGIDPPGFRPTASGPAVWKGREGPLPFDTRSLVTTRLLTPRSRLAFARFHTRLGRIDARSLDSTSVAAFLDATVGAGRADLRAILEGIVRLTLYANAPELLSAGAAIDQLVLASAGVRYLHDGWESMVDAVAAAAGDAGADLHTGVRVDAVDRVAAGWTVVDDRRRQWSTSTVVIAGLSPDATARLAGREPGALTAEAGPPVRAACLDLVLAAPPRVSFALDFDHHGYYSLHTPAADVATGGRALVSLARYRHPDEVADAERDRSSMRAFARRMGVETTVSERYLHHMTVSHGMPLAARGGLAGRPPIDALGRPGLLIAGDWVGSTGLLADASLASGRAAGLQAADLALTQRAA